MIYEINWNLDGVLPFGYIRDIDYFKEHDKIEFTKGLNVLVGENGCGKSTVVNLIKRYFLEWNGNFPDLNTVEYDHLVFTKSSGSLDEFPDGVNIVASYSIPTVSMNGFAELHGSKIGSMDTFSAYCTPRSQGENTMREYNRCVDALYCDYKRYRHPLKVVKESLPETWPLMEAVKGYYERNDRHDVIPCMIMDEPDNSVSISNIQTFMKELDDLVRNCSDGMQAIMVLHNPILLMHLVGNPKVNFIEMTPGYLDIIRKLKTQISFKS